jgi:hypothetical protein
MRDVMLTAAMRDFGSVPGVGLLRILAGPMARFAAWRRLRRERIELAAMGPAGRMELDSLLVAKGQGGLTERAWPAAQRGADALACGTSPDMRSLATAQAAAVLRSVSR